MAKPRQHHTLHYPVSQAVRLVGAERIAAALGRESTRMIYAASDPQDTSGFALSHAELMIIDRLCAGVDGSTPYASWQRERALAEAFEAPEPKPLPAEMMDVTVALGKLASTVREAMADGKLTQGERCQIATDASALMREAADLVAAVAPAGSAARPVGDIAEMRTAPAGRPAAA